MGHDIKSGGQGKLPGISDEQKTALLQYQKVLLLSD